MGLLDFFIQSAIKGILDSVTDQPARSPRPLVTAITLKLYRDQARTVQEKYLPYLGMLCESKIRDAGRDIDQLLNCRAVQSLYLSVKMQFDKKLLTSADKLSFKFSFAEALTFYRLLMSLPIKGYEIYLINLRQTIADLLFKQLTR